MALFETLYHRVNEVSLYEYFAETSPITIYIKSFFPKLSQYRLFRRSLSQRLRKLVTFFMSLEKMEYPEIESVSDEYGYAFKSDVDVNLFKHFCKKGIQFVTIDCSSMSSIIFDIQKKLFNGIVVNDNLSRQELNGLEYACQVAAKGIPYYCNILFVTQDPCSLSKIFVEIINMM